MAAETDSWIPKVFFAVATLLVCGALGLYFGLTGGPGHQELVRNDSKRVAAKSQIITAVKGDFRKFGKVTKDLSSLVARNLLKPQTLIDPVTQQPYRYTAKSDRQAELCVIYETAYEESDAPAYNRLSFPEYAWEHPKGLHCYANRNGPEGPGQAPEAASSRLPVRPRNGSRPLESTYRV